MKMSDYELVGHRFIAHGDGMAVAHHLTFSISLRLASGNKWIAYYHWVEGGFYHHRKNLPKGVVVARGRGIGPLPYRSAEAWPKDIIKGEPYSTLTYIRNEGTSTVLLRLNVQGVSPPLEFRMMEPQSSPAQEAFTYNGNTAMWEKQVLGSSVWGNTPKDQEVWSL